MNQATAVAEIIVDHTQLNRPTSDTSPLEVRWGFQMIQRDKLMHAAECGISRVPFGKFFPIATKNVPRENHTIDWTQPKEIMTFLQAADAERYLMEALGGAGAQSKVNWGLKTAFHGESDAGKMAVISEILLPTLPRIREIGRELRVNIISDVCEGSDDLDYGTRDTCVTCWWKWLNSPAIHTHIENMAMQGLTVAERDPQTGESTTRLVRPSVAELRAALAIVLESGKQGIRQLQTQWQEIAAEYEKDDGIRKDISEVEHGYRKDLHQNKPQDRQFALAREIAKGTQAGQGSNNELLAALAQSQLETNRLLQQIAAERSGGMKLAEGSEVPTVKTTDNSGTGHVDGVDFTASVGVQTITSSDNLDELLEQPTETSSTLAPAAAAMEARKNTKKEK